MAMNYWARKQKLPYGSAAKVADRLGVSRSLVSRVMKYGEGSRRVMRALARAMGVPVTVAFPGFREELTSEPSPDADAECAA
jgi:transcriptional regulator with XRE-family HTH domain